jgi:hypothetical protein
LANSGIRLILDFGPNHVALDHSWVTEHPEYFIQRNPQDAKDDPQSFVEVNGKVLACGRDPYFPAWQDVLQLNAFPAGLRQAALQTVLSIAGGCDGVRCDMAMLLLNSIFERTWGSRAGLKPTTEYWAELIAASKKNSRSFSLSPRHTGIESGNCSNKDSTTVMTSGSTITSGTATLPK